MISKKDKDYILKTLKEIDPKTLEIDHPDANKVKWFRFGAYFVMQAVCEIIKKLPEKPIDQVS